MYTEWESKETVGEYIFHDGGGGYFGVEIEIQIATDEDTDTDVYRVHERCDGGCGDASDILHDLDSARRLAKSWIEDRDDCPDLGDLIEQIVATGVLGDADEDDVRRLCKAATKHSQGVLLVPTAGPQGHMTWWTWITNGWLECDHISLDATHDRIELAAADLLAVCESYQTAD